MAFSVLSWNIQGKRHITRTSFQKIEPVLETAQADIICLQEAHEARRKLSHVGAFSSYHHVTPEHLKNQNIILSKFEPIAHGEVAFPGFAKKKLENALWADVRIDNKTLRVYNCHFGIVLAGPGSRAQQLNYVVEHAKEHDGPIIICGDMNTTMPRAWLGRRMVQLFHMVPPDCLHVEGKKITDDERYTFVRLAEKSGFREAVDLSESTWRVAPFQWEPFSLKLDWLLVRDIDTPKVTLHPYVSDHKAIHAECVLR